MGRLLVYPVLIVSANGMGRPARPSPGPALAGGLLHDEPLRPGAEEQLPRQDPARLDPARDAAGLVARAGAGAVVAVEVTEAGVMPS